MGSKVTAGVFYTNYERLKYGRQRLFNCTAEFAEDHFFKKEEDKGAKKNNKNKNKKEKDKNASSVKMEEKFCPEIDAADDSR